VGVGEGVSVGEGVRVGKEVGSERAWGGRNPQTRSRIEATARKAIPTLMKKSAFFFIERISCQLTFLMRGPLIMIIWWFFTCKIWVFHIYCG
jgi:hypothetical protein